MLNISTKEKGTPEAILIRAIQPEQGIELMKKRREKTGVTLTNGPGKMTQAMGLTMEAYGTQITEPPVYIDFSNKKEPKSILETPRIGIPNKGDWTEAPLRYIVKENAYVSRRKGKVDQINQGWRV